MTGLEPAIRPLRKSAPATSSGSGMVGPERADLRLLVLGNDLDDLRAALEPGQRVGRVELVEEPIALTAQRPTDARFDDLVGALDSAQVAEARPAHADRVIHV